MQAVLFAWLVTIVLKEPAQYVGWAQTAVLFPGMIFILIAGVLADRVGPDRQSLFAQLFAATVPWLLIVALQMDLLSYPLMIVYALLMGTAQAFVTPARDGLLNHVAGDQVQRTVLLASLCQFSFQILGYAIAGFAENVGAEIILVFQSLGLLAGAAAFWMIRRRSPVPPESGAKSSVLNRMRTGAATVWASPEMRVVVIQNVAMACFFMSSFVVCFPLVVRDVFAGSSQDLAVLSALNSLGLVATILIMLKLGYVSRPGRALIVFQALGSLALAASALAGAFVWFCVAIFVWGLCGGIAIPMSRTLMQQLAPADQRARVMSFYALSFMGAGPIGTVLAGYLSAAYGPQGAILINAALMLLVVVLVTAFTQIWSATIANEQPV